MDVIVSLDDITSRALGQRKLLDSVSELARSNSTY